MTKMTVISIDKYWSDGDFHQITVIFEKMDVLEITVISNKTVILENGNFGNHSKSIE